jgi:ABC-type dipeptide/oligopeptide/nickel transport system permease subunit
MVGLAIIAVLVLVAVVGPFLVPYPDDAAGAVNIREKLDPPTRPTSSAPTRSGATSSPASSSAPAPRCWPG